MNAKCKIKNARFRGAKRRMYKQEKVLNYVN